MTAEQFDALPGEEGINYELLDGELIEVPTASLRHNRIAGLLTTFLNNFLLQNPLAIVAPETEFGLGENRLQPDVAVVAMEKYKRAGEGRSPVREVPEIAVEIVSPSESAIDVERKTAAYLRGRVREVWVIYQETEHIYVYTIAGVRLLDREAILETPVLPGWSLRVGEIFRD